MCLSALRFKFLRWRFSAALSSLALSGTLDLSFDLALGRGASHAVHRLIALIMGDLWCVLLV